MMGTGRTTGTATALQPAPSPSKPKIRLGVMTACGSFRGQEGQVVETRLGTEWRLEPGGASE